nr:non-structural polyprotein [Flumine dicistrovirus 34]
MRVEPNVELGVGVAHITEFTRDWFDVYENILLRHDFSGHQVTPYNYRFTTCYIPVSIHWFKFLQQFLECGILFDEIRLTLPYHDILGASMRLLLSGDVESNPGPVFSRPLPVRNNDPRLVKLENALNRRDQKIKTLIKQLRQSIKSNRIYPQGFFDTLKDGNQTIKESAGELNANLTRMCDFLENSLPAIQTSIQSTVLNTTDGLTNIKDDLIKITLVCLIIRLIMVWKHYKTALVIILLFIIKFYGFDQTIIDLVMELKGKCFAQVAPETKNLAEEVVYHPYFQTCGKLIFAVIAFICIRKIPGKQDWDNYIMRLDRIPKALDGSKKIFDFCSEYFNLANDQVKMMVLGKTREELSRANGLYGEIHEWAAEVRTYLDLEQRNKIDTDITIANRVEDLYKRGVKYQSDTLLDREISRLVATTLLPARELYQYVSSSPVKGGGPRMRPICLWLVGESGVGKTEMVYPLCIDVLRTMGLMKKEDFHHQVYGRQVETEFWDGLSTLY